MKKRKINDRVPLFLLTAFILSFIGCAPFKKALVKSGKANEAIQNAILDFVSTHGKTYKRNAVFSVSFRDTLYKTIDIKLDNGNYVGVHHNIDEDMVAVTILPSQYKFLLTSDIKIGCKTWLPSRFLEKDGKLFYWFEDSYPLTTEALAVFKKYNIVEDDKGGTIKYIDNGSDERTKAVDYFFAEIIYPVTKK